ncbi:MAG TPA: dihydrofolate reductase family protein [Chloroflexia bacterium]|nr:dihydrofolate reductase family protein [Chloroflexia bacterium]
MRKLVVTEFVSLDGVMEEPTWTMPYWSDEIARFKGAESDESDMLLLGRITYEGFAQAWPTSTDEGADKMNSMPKYVVTTSLDRADWNNSTIIRENVMKEIARLKQQDGGNILVYGSGVLVDSLMEAGLVDQYRLLVYPVVVGSGKRLFKDNRAATLKLASSQNFDTGVVALIYQPA